jgi:hypothetical protein
MPQLRLGAGAPSLMSVLGRLRSAVFPKGLLPRAPAVRCRRCSLWAGARAPRARGRRRESVEESTPSCRMPVTQAAAGATHLGSRSHRYGLFGSRSHCLWTLTGYRRRIPFASSCATRRRRDLRELGVRPGCARGARSAPLCTRRQLATPRTRLDIGSHPARHGSCAGSGEARAHSGLTRSHAIVQVFPCSPGARRPARHRHALGAHSF